MKRKLLALVFSLGMTMSLVGCSVQGPKGETGQKGDKGDQGEPRKDGNSIVSIIKVKTNDNVDIYEITYSDGSKTSFSVTNGIDGEQGIQGEPGKDGQDGVSITKIEKTSSKGNIDTYTITYSDGTTSTFTVTNGNDGAQGEQGIQGEPGQDGHTPKIEIGSNGNWYIDGKDSGISALGKEKDDQYQVTYHLNGGTMPYGHSTYVTVTWGNTIDLPIPTKKGHVFKGWFTGNTVNDRQFYNFDPVCKNLDLYAKWEVGTYKVTLDLDGGTYEGSKELTFKYGESYSLPTTIYKKGFNFDGWMLDNKVIPNTGIYNYENIVLKATYSVAQEFTITLNLNGGTYDGAKEIVVRTNEEYTLPREGVTNGDQVFVGWYNGAEKWEDTGLYPLKENIYLAAKWEALETYNLTFDFNGGTSSSGNSLKVTNRDFYNNMVTLPSVTKDGFELYGYSIGNYLIADSNKKLDLGLLRSVFEGQKDLTLTAKYIGLDDTHVGDYYKFGSYPQTKVKNASIAEALKSAKDTDGDGYLNYGNDEYKEVAKSYNNDGGFFKVEPIVWEVKNDGTLVSSVILDSKCYNYTTSERNYQGVQIHGNNYKYSTIRAFLNGYNGSAYEVENFEGKGFIDLAFTQEEQAKILETMVDNSAQTTDNSSNQYVCENTNDKIYLMSYSEMEKTDYGYKNNRDRMRKGTDYAMAKGLSVNSSNNHSYYWTRSPDSGSSNSAWYVNDYGNLRYGCSVSGGNGGVLPALKISK